MVVDDAGRAWHLRGSGVLANAFEFHLKVSQILKQQNVISSDAVRGLLHCSFARSLRTMSTMSSPQSSIAASTRSNNPRRKRRADGEVGGSVTKQPQRKRTKLSSEIQQPKTETEVDQDGPRTNGHAPRERLTLNRDVAVRGKPIAPAQKRVVKDDGAIILVSLRRRN